LGINNDSVPKQTALEAFAYLYQVDIPGVTVPQGIEGGDEPTDGSGALRWVQAHWSELTPDQQAVINRYTTPGPNDRVFHLDATASGASPTTTLAVWHQNAPAQVQLAGAPVDIATGLKQELLADIKHIGPKLGLQPISQGSFLWKDVTLTLSDKDGGRTLLTTSAAVNKAGVYSPCNVIAFKNAWSGETVGSDGKVSPRLQRPHDPRGHPLLPECDLGQHLNRSGNTRLDNRGNGPLPRCRRHGYCGIEYPVDVAERLLQP
jgi:hypothetical protein